MLFQHLIYFAKVHPWWIAASLVCLVILIALRSLAQARCQASKTPQFDAVPSEAEGENQGQLKRTTRLGFLHRKGFQSACQVVVLTRELQGLPPIVVARYIQSVEMSLPSGEYQLSLDGLNLKARHVDSAWTVYL